MPYRTTEPDRLDEQQPDWDAELDRAEAEAAGRLLDGREWSELPA